MKTKQIALLILLFGSKFIVAQSNNAMNNLSGPSINNSRELLSNALNYPGSWKGKTIRKTVLGSPYAFDKNNSNLTIHTIDGKKYKIPNGNYNVFNKKIVSELEKDSVYNFNDSNIRYIRINNLIGKQFKNDKDQKNFYFILNKSEGNVKLLKGFHGRIMEGTRNALTKEKISEDRYSIKEKYFISFDNKQVVPFKLKKKTLLKKLKKNKDKIISFVKKNKLTYKKEKDMIKIIDYYNSL